MKYKLNTKSALIVVFFYIVFSIIAALIASIIFGGIKVSDDDTLIEGVIDSGMYGYLIVMVVLLFICIYVFKDSRKDIFFERKSFSLSKLYYLFPLAWFSVTIFALFNVDYSAYSIPTILLVLVAAFAIGVNEEIVTRGIMLVGLRNSGVAEWIAWLVSILVFALLHLVNVIGGANPSILIVTLTGGVLLYVGRRVFNNLFVPIVLHALYDTAFFLLTGIYTVGQNLPDHVLDIQLGSFLVLLLASLLFVIFGRGLLKNETTGW